MSRHGIGLVRVPPRETLRGMNFPVPVVGVVKILEHLPDVLVVIRAL
jgi:hypothetical protein